MSSFCCGIDADHPARRTVELGEDRLHRDHVSFWPSRSYSISIGLPPLFLVISWNLICEWIGCAVDRDQQVALLQPGLFGGHAGLHGAQLHLAPLSPSRRSPCRNARSSVGVTTVSKRLPSRSIVRCMGR